MSSTIINVFVILASQILPNIGVNIGNADLTTAVTTIITIISAVWIWVSRVKKGDVKPFGKRK